MTNEERMRWYEKVIATFQEGKDLKIPLPIIVGTFLGCAIAAAKEDGAIPDNIVQIVRDEWSNPTPDLKIVR